MADRNTKPAWGKNWRFFAFFAKFLPGRPPIEAGRAGASPGEAGQKTKPGGVFPSGYGWSVLGDDVPVQGGRQCPQYRQLKYCQASLTNSARADTVASAAHKRYTRCQPQPSLTQPESTPPSAAPT